ncbi:MAG: hypothetical protein AAF585_18840 [Verrucomicrobiota bacterium]
MRDKAHDGGMKRRTVLGTTITGCIVAVAGVAFYLAMNTSPWRRPLTPGPNSTLKFEAPVLRSEISRADPPQWTLVEDYGRFRINSSIKPPPPDESPVDHVLTNPEGEFRIEVADGGIELIGVSVLLPSTNDQAPKTREFFSPAGKRIEEGSVEKRIGIDALKHPYELATLHHWRGRP